jgi:tetratricopeptide (TPR) repeat protein
MMNNQSWGRLQLLLNSGNEQDAIAFFNGLLSSVQQPVQCLFSCIDWLQENKLSHLQLAFISEFLVLFPNQPHAVFKAGQVLFQQGRFNDAVNVLNSIPQGDALPESQLLLAEVFSSQGDFGKAHRHYCSALELLDDEQSLCLFANFLQKHIYGERDLSESVVAELRQLVDTILSRWPKHRVACLAMLADCHTACTEYRASIDILESIRDTNNLDREENLAYQYLSLGEFEIGFRQAMDRNRALIDKEGAGWLTSIDWYQVDEQVDRLVIFADQGVGDQILNLQFISLIKPQLYQHVILVCETRMCSLFQRSLDDELGAGRVSVIDSRVFNLDMIQSGGQSVKKALLSDLPCLLGVDSSYVNTRRSYLSPDKALVEHFREKYKHSGKPNVGLSWFSSRDKNYKRKNIALTEWQDVLQLPNVAWISIQYGDVQAEVQHCKEQYGVSVQVDALDYFNDIESVVAQIAALDQVACISTASAHIAGALGVPAVVMVPYSPLWYWNFVDNNQQSVWYPSVNLVYRKQANIVDPQLVKLKEALAQLTK